MQEKNIKKKTTWRNWLIKKLLTDETNKEDILSFIAKEEKNAIFSEDNKAIEDNNEKMQCSSHVGVHDCALVPRCESVDNY